MMNTLFFIPKAISIGPLKITFYAIFILIGAILAYKLSQGIVKKKGYDTSYLETLFYVAFPAGIIGARIWYVIATFPEKFANRPFYEVFYIWEGGLAIQGGVLLGVIVGVLFMLKFRPNIPTLWVADIIVPHILLAQAIGRIGNFFNQEVYGGCVDAWEWLPDFIQDRLTLVISDTGYTGEYLCPGEGSQMVLPLFMIEGLINVAGYFILRFGVPALFKWIGKISSNKVTLAPGDLMCGYFIWYGTVRAILEPLRNSKDIMGDYVSVWASLVYILIGVVGIVLCHVFRHKWENKILKTQVVENSEAAETAVDVTKKD